MAELSPGLRVSFDERIHVASLRYFDSRGAFSHTVSRVVGLELPNICRASVGAGGIGPDRTILAWRSPTETLLLSDETTLIEQLEGEAALHPDGCIVELTGGACVVRADGEAVPELFTRIGGQATWPGLGEARRSRLADVPVLALQVQLGEILLVLDRVYVEHLMSWIRATAADLKAF
jgi:hypothetical protein